MKLHAKKIWFEGLVNVIAVFAFGVALGFLTGVHTGISVGVVAGAQQYQIQLLKYEACF